MNRVGRTIAPQDLGRAIAAAGMEGLRLVCVGGSRK